MSAAPTKAALAVRGLSLDVAGGGWWPRRRVRLLDGLDLSLAPGEIVGVVGESGSGKTTLGKTLVGLHAPSAGSIHLGDVPLARLGERGTRADRHRLQMVFQDPLSSFNPRFRIGAALDLALRLHRPGSAAARNQAREALLAQVGLTPAHGARFPHELSGGQLQRIALARALAVAPDWIIADEAVSKLDVSVRAQVLNLIKRTNRETGIGFLFITHDLNVARFLCHRIAVMYFGRIVEIGPAAAVLSAPRHPYTARLVAAKGAAITAAVGPVAAPAAGSGACHYAGACPRRLPRCAQQRPAIGAVDGVACFNPMPLRPADADAVAPVASAPLLAHDAS